MNSIRKHAHSTHAVSCQLAPDDNIGTWTDNELKGLQRRSSGRVWLPELVRAGLAALAAAGSYGAFYGLASQAYGFVGSGASGTMYVLSYLLFAVAMSVGGGTLLSRALGVSPWWRSTLISAAAHAIGIPLWIVAWNNLTSYPEPHGVFGEQPLLSFSAATYAFVVPLVVVFSSFRENALGGWAVAIALSAATVALPAAAVLVDSEELAVTSGVVAWVVLPAVSVLGSAMIEPRSHP